MTTKRASTRKDFTQIAIDVVRKATKDDGLLQVTPPEEHGVRSSV